MGAFLSWDLLAAVTDAPAGPLAPIALLLLCVLAGIGTVLALPGRIERAYRFIGGVLLLTAGAVLVGLLVRWAATTPGGGMGVYFWLFTAIAVFGAARVVTHAKPVYSALYFVLTVFALGGLFLLMWAEFMAAALILIYAGAILVTYVFVIMLAAEATPQAGPLAGLAEHDAVSRAPLSGSAIGFALMGVMLLVIFDRFAAPGRTPGVETPGVRGASQQLGVFLFSTHLIALQVSGLILTIAVVGAAMIARRKILGGAEADLAPDILSTPATPVSDNPHSIPVHGTENPRQKAYPEA